MFMNFSFQVKKCLEEKETWFNTQMASLANVPKNQNLPVAPKQFYNEKIVSSHNIRTCNSRDFIYWKKTYISIQFGFG